MEVLAHHIADTLKKLVILLQSS